MAGSRTLLLVGLLVTAAVLIPGCGGGGDDDSNATTAAESLRDCNISGRQQNLGASYVTTIKVENVGCGQAEKVVTAYHACRTENGGPGGTCDTAVLGYDCTEGQRQEVPGVQFNATAYCRSGEHKISSSYTQNF